MPDTRVAPRKATDQLKWDHREVKQLFREYEKVKDESEDEKVALFEEIRTKLTIHAQIEEEIFYPAIEQDGDEESQELIDEAHEEHKIVKQLLEELSELEPDDDQFDAKMKVLEENVEHHAEEEEAEIFPKANRLPRETRDEMASDMAKRRAELTGEEE